MWILGESVHWVQDPVSKFARGLNKLATKSSCERRTVLINRHPEVCGDTLRVRVLDDLMEEGSNDQGNLPEYRSDTALS